VLAEARAGGGSTPPPPFMTTLRWLTRTQRGLCITAAVAAFALLAVAAAWLIQSTPAIGIETSAVFAAASAGLWLPLLLLLLDPSDNMAKGPGLALPSATLVLLATLAGVTVAAHAGAISVKLAGAPLLAFFVMLATTFTAPVWNARAFAAHKKRDIVERELAAARRRAKDNTAERKRADELDQRQSEHDAAESLGALIGTVGVLLVCALAWMAGAWGKDSPLQSNLGVAICFGVFTIFTVVVLMKWIADAPPVRALARLMRGLARRLRRLAEFYNAIDAILVRIGAHVAGMEHRTMPARYIVLGATLISLSVMAWHLPPPWGLVPATLGFLIALSVSRLWSWVEDDRNLAAITRFNPDAPVRIGFREDYRDETIFGFIFVLILIPIAMAQADASKVFGGSLFEPKGQMNELREWLGYLGFELAKALPVIDWADIYELKPGDTLPQPTKPLGQHAVFAARVTVDLILIASLLQAIGIATRNRQQKALYAAGHVDRLDALVERHELRKAINSGRPNWFCGAVDFRRYNLERLKELYQQSESARAKAFISEIFRQGGLTLDPAIIVLERLSRTTRNEGEMHRTLDAAEREHLSGAYSAPIGDLMQIMENLRATSGLKDIKFDLLRFAAKIGSPVDVTELLMGVMMDPGIRDNFQYTRLEAARLMRSIVPQLADPSVVAEALEMFERNRAVFGAAVALPGLVIEALRKRLDELRPPHPGEQDEPPPNPENKP